MNVLDQLHFLSRLIQPRGLKSLLPDDIQVFDTVEAYTASWIEIIHMFFIFDSISVEAYTASWIEIWLSMTSTDNFAVEAYTASWIEICNQRTQLSFIASRLIQPRGLKSGAWRTYR